MAKKSLNPYSSLPDHCFWTRAHRDKKMREIDPVIKAGFKLKPKMKIATAGSCFAQHIARHLKALGYNYFVAEKPHPIISAAVAKDFNYGIFSARYGNLYTVRQLLQLAKRALGTFTPEEDVWERDGRYYDPYRPNIQPNGYKFRQDVAMDREKHFAAVREILDKSDVFVFTLGLTEAWISKSDGAVFPLAPGVAAGEYKKGKHEFVNFSVQEIVDDFKEFAALLRKNNPKVKILLTVSPVPLMATAREDQSVITATSYSKSVLRVAAEELTNQLDETYYFPSYEVITGNYNRGSYYAADLREVEEQGVSHAMSLFMKHYTNMKPTEMASALVENTETADVFKQENEKALQIICDEELIGRS